MARYALIEVGCIECGDLTIFRGLFDSVETAEMIADQRPLPVIGEDESVALSYRSSHVLLDLAGKV